MNSFVVCFFACLAVASAYSSAHVLQGPSSRTTLVGPEGSVISAVAPGGQVITEQHSGVVGNAAPLVSYAAPVVAHAAPIVAHAAPVVAHAVPAVHGVVAARYGHANTVVAGPSGTIVSGQAVAHAPVAAYTVPVGTYAGLHYGDQYVHDHSEALYDDGSYKPDVYY